MAYVFPPYWPLNERTLGMSVLELVTNIFADNKDREHEYKEKEEKRKKERKKKKQKRKKQKKVSLSHL